MYELVGAGPGALAAPGRRRARAHPVRRARRPSWSSSARPSSGAGAGHGQVVAVVGEPGVGKSRLFWEFTHSHRIDGWLLLESGSVSYGKATPYLPVIDLLAAYFRDRGARRRARDP